MFEKQRITLGGTEEDVVKGGRDLFELLPKAFDGIEKIGVSRLCFAGGVLICAVVLMVMVVGVSVFLLFLAFMMPHLCGGPNTVASPCCYRGFSIDKREKEMRVRLRRGMSIYSFP